MHQSIGLNPDTINGSLATKRRAYDITTGALKSTNPGFNGDVRGLAVSPDKATVYAVGSFTTAGGQTSVMPCSRVWTSRNQLISARWRADPAPL